LLSWSATCGWFAVASAIATGIKTASTFKSTQERKRVTHEDYTRKTLFDTELADHFFLTVVKKLADAGLNLVFVFDEMDKVDEKSVDKLSTDIKPYMLSGYAHFIVVSGQKLFYQYKQANTEDDAVLSSIFSRSVHLRLLSRPGFHDLFTSLVSTSADGVTALPSHAISFIDYLIFLSKRVPRKFFQLLLEQIRWEPGDKATLFIPDQDTDTAVYSQLLAIIDSIEKDLIAPESLHPAEKDLFIMQLFLAATIVMENRNRNFEIDDLLPPLTGGNRADGFPPSHYETRLHELQRQNSTRLLADLKEAKIIPASNIPPADSPSTNQPSQPQPLPLAIGSPFAVPDPIAADIHRLFELQNLVNQVSVGLGLVNPQDLGAKTFSQLLRRLAGEKALTVPFIDDQPVTTMLDQLAELNRDAEGQDHIKTILTGNPIPILPLTNQLMEFYGKRKADEHFYPLGYVAIADPDTEGYDYRLHSHERHFKQLLFDFVVRRGDPLKERQFFSDRLRKFQSFSPQYFFFFIVFSDLNSAAQEAARRRFSDWLKEDADMTLLADRVMFLPVNFNELSSLQKGFSTFSNQYIKRHWEIIFKEQPSPFGYHERNDHEFEEFLEFKKYNLTVHITPKQSKYWRFGLRFLKEKRLPPRNQGRHADHEIADITLCAGEATKKDDGHHTWNHPERLAISPHHISPTKSELAGVTNYNESPLTLTAHADNDGQQVNILVEGSQFGRLRQIYDLREYKYCILSAWCEDQPFILSTNITLERKVD